MDDYILIIGSRDFSSWIKEDGYKAIRNDLDGENAGRTIGNGNMIRDRIAQKWTVTASFRDLTNEQMAILESWTDPEWLTVTFVTPGGMLTRTMYCSTFPAPLAYSYNGRKLWKGAEITLVER